MQQAETAKSGGRLWRRLRRAGFALAVLAAVLAAIGYYYSTPRPAPDWLRARLETRLNAALPAGSVSVGGVDLALFQNRLNPRIGLRDVVFRDAQGQLRARLPELSSELDGPALIGGRLRPVQVEARRARIRLSRDSAGRFGISVEPVAGPGPAAPDPETDSGSVNDILTDFENLLGLPLLSRLAGMRSTATTVLIEDAPSGRSWAFSDGVLEFGNDDKAVSASVTVTLARADAAAGPGADTTAAWARLGLRREKGATDVLLTTRFQGVNPARLATDIAGLEWLEALDAPLAGSVSLTYGADDSFKQVHGVLELGPGRLRPGAGMSAFSAALSPLAIGGGKAYLAYDDKTGRLRIDELTLRAAGAEILAEGHLDLRGSKGEIPTEAIAQLRFRKVRLDAEGLFDGALEFAMGAMDARLRVNPLRLDLGQLVLAGADDGGRLRLSGRAEAGEAGWSTAFDLRADALSRERLMAMWPLTFKPKTRLWLEKNVLEGRATNIAGALRTAPGRAPVLNLGFDVSGLKMRYIRTLPPLENGAGYGVLADNGLTMVLERGTVTAPDGGVINAAGTRFRIPDTRIKQPPSVVSLKTQSALGAVLTLIDLPPFAFLSKAGIATDIARGTVAIEGEIGFPLVERVTLDQVALSLNGRLSDVESDKLIRGKTLRADTLQAFVNNDGLRIGGEARLAGVPLSGSWQKDFGPANRGRSRFEGQVEMSRRFLDAFHITLPEGAVKGRGVGHVTIDLERGQAPAFSLVSDLNRVRLALDALGWSKPKNVTAHLEIGGRFADPPVIEELHLTAPGLRARGDVRLKEGGRLDVARFDEFALGDWMSTPIEVLGDGKGGVAFRVDGGQVDFRRSRFAQGETPPPGEGNRISVRLDRLVLSDGISLTEVTGEMDTGGGVSGAFTGRVNGGGKIKGALAPYGGSVAVRFTSPDAGAVMRAAGLFDSVVGGRLDMLLVPTGRRGEYDGSLTADGARVRNASTLADILSAISVVGLLEQLGGEGILFNDVSASFLLRPDSILLKRSSAVGASLGITMEGVYDAGAGALDMQGVITPVYVLNGILEQAKVFGNLFGRQKGEGLVGVNYTLKGPIGSPRVAVNPLSILTPGIFRELFRRPPPQRGQ